MIRKLQSMLLLFFWLLPLCHSQTTPRPSALCARVHESFCCTSRIRQQCAAKCASVDCSHGFVEKMFSSDVIPQRNWKARDGSVAVTRVQTELGNGFDHIQPPPPAVPGPSHGNIDTITPAPSSSGGFATLIPFEPNIDETISLRDKDTGWTTKTTQANHRRTPDPRIIRPPESLVNFGDYDIEDEKVDQTTKPWVQPSQWSNRATTRAPAPPAQAPEPNSSILGEKTRKSGTIENSTGRSLPSPPKKLNCKVVRGRLRCIRKIPKKTSSKRNFVTNRIVLPPLLPTNTRLHRSFSTKWRNSPNWSVAIARSKSQPTKVDTVPPFAVDGTALVGKPREHKLTAGIESLLNGFSIVPSSKNMRERSKGTEFEPQVGHVLPVGELEIISNVAAGSDLRTTAGTFLPSTVLITTTMAAPQCGVAPDFTPCVSSEIASKALLQCCRNKNLPTGCLHLCRYDITQAEVRAALDRGQCGIFSVAPFLECAAQGKDNSQCCSYKGIARKTGPQCEQFCRPSNGLTALGLQHVICGNAIGDLLQCHHSGIRI